MNNMFIFVKALMNKLFISASEQIVHYEMMNNRIKELRTKAKISQQALADELGVSWRQINYLENGGRNLTQKWMERIAPVLKCLPGELVSQGDVPTERNAVDLDKLYWQVLEMTIAITRDHPRLTDKQLLTTARALFQAARSGKIPMKGTPKKVLETFQHEAERLIAFEKSRAS